MSRGGARNRSGPAPDPNSGKSDRRGLVFSVLPAAGYDGDAPDFPLMETRESEAFADREAELWAWVWTTPQAVAWAVEAWRWHTVAMWVRTAVVCESDRATAADKGSLHRFADQIGLTPAGLKENGWQIGTEPAAATATMPAPEPTLRDQAAADAGWKIINGGRAV